MVPLQMNPKLEVLHLFRWFSHTCSETSFRITDVECIVRAKNTPVKPDRKNWLTRRESLCEEKLAMSGQDKSTRSDAAQQIVN